MHVEDHVSETQSQTHGESESEISSPLGRMKIDDPDRGMGRDVPLDKVTKNKLGEVKASAASRSEVT
jgi:hypothetical protein